MTASYSYCEIALSDLQAYDRNARTHSRKQIEQIVESIRTFGYTNPVLIDECNVLIAGHGRSEAARQLGMETVPAIVIQHLSESEKRALRLADNKIALNAGWDFELLAVELDDLSKLDLSFDLEVTGFEVPEIDLIIGDARDAEAEEEVAPLPNPHLFPVTRRGDLWELGAHRVLCGCGRSSESYTRLMQDEVADVCFTDPPYNVPISGHVSGNGRVQHREFAEASGEMSREEFTEFLTSALTQVARNSRDGAVSFACMDWRHMGELLAAGEEALGPLLNLCVWVKTNGGMGSLYRSQQELVFVFRKGSAPHRNNVQLGRYGRNRTNVWTYPGVNTFRAGRMKELAAHPTAKPVAMVQDALLDVSRRGDTVLDPFLGAGATLIAAQRSGRRARGIEIDPLYIDVVLRRWRDETGEEPVRVSDGMSLASIEAEAA